MRGKRTPRLSKRRFNYYLCWSWNLFSWTFALGSFFEGVGLLVGFIGIGTMAAGYLYPNTSEELTKAAENFEEKLEKFMQPKAKSFIKSIFIVAILGLFFLFFFKIILKWESITKVFEITSKN